MDADTQAIQKKILIEKLSISPIHMCLEVFSWGGRSVSKDKLTIDKDFLKRGVHHDENVLTADFLQALNFMDRGFTNKILSHSTSAVAVPEFTVKDDSEIIGNCGNFWFPHASSHSDKYKNIRLCQPDGLIADSHSLALLEMKGYAKGAGLNPGQLAKEYIIAEQEATQSGKAEFLILMIMPEKHLKHLPKDFQTLFATSVNELREWTPKNESPEKLIKLRNRLDAIQTTEAIRHFRWISWEDIRSLAENIESQCAKDICNAIDFHSSGTSTPPPFSQLLQSMAQNDVLLSRLYNGGCGYKPVKDFDKQYLKTHTPESDSAKIEARHYAKWHNLREGRYASMWRALETVDELRSNLHSGKLRFQDESQKPDDFSTRPLWKALMIHTGAKLKRNYFTNIEQEDG